MTEAFKRKKEGSFDLITLTKKGEAVGEAHLVYFSEPFPIYYVTFLAVEHGKRGEGWGKRLLQFVEETLRQEHKIGILRDGIDADSPAKGMYPRHGWVPIPDLPGFYAFNLPEGTDASQLKGFSDALSRWRIQARQRSLRGSQERI